MSHPKSGRVLEVYSDQPGVQLYTSNYMPDPNNQVNLMLIKTHVKHAVNEKIIDTISI